MCFFLSYTHFADIYLDFCISLTLCTHYRDTSSFCGTASGWDVGATAGTPDWHAKRFGFEYIICNAFMASTPDNDFINFVCQRLINHSGGKVVNNGFDILDSTGPFLLTHAFNAFPHKEDIRILESKTIYPIGQWEVEKIKNNQIPKEMEERINQAHAIHYFFGTWFGK